MTGRIFDNLPENLRKTVILLKKTSTVGRIDLGCGYRQISPIITQMKRLHLFTCQVVMGLYFFSHCNWDIRPPLTISSKIYIRSDIRYRTKT